MIDTRAARPRSRRSIRAAVLAATVVVAGTTLAGALAAGSSSGERVLLPTLRGIPGIGVPGEVGEGDGVLPSGTTVADDRYPGVGRLDPELLGALRRAASAAAAEGIEFEVTSGWRSAAYQDQLLAEAVVQYGSREEAARWVATADTSAHVSGRAVDIGPWDASTWLGERGADYGLCRTYDNEPWHYELLPEAVENGCPTPYADPTADPRMQG
ncbi:MAG TPA: M15 family metallopeptidase [Naasia sp.]|jgi:hypothetical protein